MVNEQTGEGTVTDTTESLGMTTGEVVNEEEPKRSRGRPTGWRVGVHRGRPPSRETRGRASAR